MAEYQKIQNLGEPGNGEAGCRYLTFLTDGQLFGISITEVVQIVGMQQITRVPDCPAYVKGVISLRGEIIPVIDVRIRFGRPEGSYNDRTCIIITSLPGGSFGFIVDGVDEVCGLLPGQIVPPPQVKNASAENWFLKGIAILSQGQEEKEKMILVIDASRLLKEDEFFEIAQIAKI